MITAPFDARIVSGLSHLIALFGILMLIIQVLALPVFPISMLWYMIPNLLFLLLYWKRSPYARAHLLQANAIHIFGLLIGEMPWVMRQLVTAGLLGENWFYTGFQGAGITPTWSLMTLVIAFWAIFIFTTAIEGAVNAFAGNAFRYPGVGRLLPTTRE